MTPRLGHLSQRLFNTPLAVLPEKAEMAMAALAERLGLARIARSDGSMVEIGAALGPAEAGVRRERGYDVLAGVAVIAVEGLLVQKLGSLRPWCGMTGYDGIRQNLLTALADPEVRAIVLDLDSPGGEVAGCFDLVDTIFAARGTKPIWGICAEAAYSAAYALASACDRITLPRTGGVGSVGVITMLVDLSRSLDEAGITVHFVTYGAQKAEESRAELTGVSDELLGRIQARIDEAGELFVGTVARNRGVSPDSVRAQQAACFNGATGVTQGLADAVMAPDAAFRALLATLD